MPEPTPAAKAVVAVALLLGATLAHAASAYDDLIEQARAGETAPALRFFNEADARAPLSAAQVNDWILISNWAGRDAETLAVHARHHRHVALQASSLAAVGRALRNTGEWRRAAGMFEQAIAREPAHGDWYLAAAHAWADAGDAARAGEQLDAFAARFPERRLDEWLARSYVAHAAGQPYEALQFAGAAIQAAPEHREAQARYLSALQASGLPQQALQTIDEQGLDWVDPATRRVLEADHGAELVRMALTEARSEADRHAVAHRALAYYDALLQRWASEPHQDEALAQDIRRARLDRLATYWHVRDTTRVLHEYAELKAQDPFIPDYALLPIGAALLDAERPHEALPVYAGVARRTEGRDPEHHAIAHAGEFYARIESEDLDRARQLAERHLGQLAPERHVAGNLQPLPNDDWSAAQRAVASADLFADRLARAQRALEHMAALGPGDSHTRLTLASVYRNRGWPRRAADELRIAQANEDPLAVPLLIEQAGVAQELQDWTTADALVAHLQQRHPEDSRVRDTVRDWAVAQKPELRITTEYSDSNGPQASGEGATRHALVAYSAPIRHRWRLFASTSHASGDFPEGRGRSRHLGAGLEWRHRDTEAEMELYALRAGGRTRTGLRLQASHAWGDVWQLRGHAAARSVDTPVRAQRAGITADEAGLALQWRAHESTHLALELGAMDFSDGNLRRSVRLDGQQRLWTAAHFQLDAELELHHGRNSRPGGPYFAPERDWSVLPGLTARHILHRHYDRTWRHELHAAAGRYRQRHFGSGAYQQVRYSQELQWNDTTTVGFQAGVSWRPYDGVRERATHFGIDFNHRF